MKILLLGSSGRLGTAMQERWKDRHQLVSPGRELPLLIPKDLSIFLEQTAPELVINLVAYNDVDKAEQEQPTACFELNVQAPAHIARACVNQNIPLVHLSTDYVFDGTRPEGYTEDASPKPQSLYGLTKYLGEQAVLATHPKSYIVRTSRLYGARARSENAKKSFIDLIIRDAEQAEQFLVNGAERTSPTFVNDLVDHIETHLFSFPAPGVYHMTNEGGATWFEWASEIIRILNLPVRISPRDPATLNRPAPRPSHSILLSTKLPPMRPWQTAHEEFLMQYPPAFSPVWQRSKS